MMPFDGGLYPQKVRKEPGETPYHRKAFLLKQRVVAFRCLQ